MNASRIDGLLLATGLDRLPLEVLQRTLLWLFVFSGWFVFVEPAPYEMLFLATLLVFLPAGLTVTVAMAPLVVFLLLYNAGGVASVMPVAEDQKAVTFVVISVYMAFTAFFFAFAVVQDPVGRMRVIWNAWVLAAVMASVLGIMGYFDIAGTRDLLAPMGRAQSTFKDPNVFTTFLIPPAVHLLQAFALKQLRRPILSLGALLLMVAAIFLGFSRGAWASLGVSSVLMLAVTFIVSGQDAVRSRIVLVALMGGGALFAMLSFALTFSDVGEMFAQRASLHQYYDVGETGRFGSQLNSIPMLLERPNGFGPLQFSEIFKQDPHNVYLNAFASYGWLGGIGYFLLVLSTVAIGWRIMFTPTPWQMSSIAVFCPLLTTIAQGMQIDTDHWRHFYLLLGLAWGLFAATLMWQTQRRAAGGQAGGALPVPKPMNR